jgi:hypothetical protein
MAGRVAEGQRAAAVTTRRRQGEVEKATRAFVRDMGKLSPRQQVTAAQALTLARLVDEEVDGSKASALSRELRQVVTALTPVAQPMTPRAKGDAGPPDKVTDIQEALARKQRQRGG